jgi:hypothetical protein
MRYFLRTTELGKNISIVDTSSVGSANKTSAWAVMGYKFYIGITIKARKAQAFLVEKRVDKEVLKVMRQYDVVISPWGLLPDRIELDNGKSIELTSPILKDAPILNEGQHTARWLRALNY